MTLKENKVKKKTESFTKTNENPTEKNVVENKKQKSRDKEVKINSYEDCISCIYQHICYSYTYCIVGSSVCE